MSTEKELVAMVQRLKAAAPFSVIKVATKIMT